MNERKKSFDAMPIHRLSPRPRMKNVTGGYGSRAVVMGEKFAVNGSTAKILAQLGAQATDQLSDRIPLPASVARELAFRLEVCV